MSLRIPSETKQSVLNRVKFAGRDFFTSADDLISRIKNYFGDEFNDFVSSGTGQMLIDMVAWASETLSFYIDRQATESYLETARTRRAVNRLARQIGYKVRYAVPASTDLQVRLAKTYTFDVTIPKGFRFRSDNGIIYEAQQDVTFPAGEGPTSAPRQVSVREGETKTETFISDGSAHQRFSVNPGKGKWVAGGTVRVFVGGVEWSESDFITFDATDQFEFDYAVNPATLYFGDGSAGNIPPAGAEIRVEYVSTLGASGMVLSGNITKEDKPLTVAFQPIQLLIEQPNPSTGGSDPESIASVKSIAPGFFASRGVAVTKNDYVSLSKAFSDPHAGSVAEAQAFVAHSASSDFTLLGLLSSIRSTAEDIVSTILGYTGGIETNANEVLTNKASIDTSSTNIGASVDTITTNPLDVSATGKLPDTRDNVLSAIVNLNNILDETTKPTPNLTLIQNEANAAKSSLNTASLLLGDIELEVKKIGDENASISSSASAIETDANNILTYNGLIESKINSDFQTPINSDLDAIFAHVDGFLSDPCKANLVQVPILTRDSDGFLVAPSRLLISRLQAYLDERKEITQVVEVVSGEDYLVKAEVEAKVAVADGFVVSEVLSNVQTRIEDLIRGKQFGEDLRLSELYAAVSPDPGSGYGGVDGVRYVTIKIAGPTSNLDADGNLVVDDGYVVTRGSITVTAS